MGESVSDPKKVDMGAALALLEEALRVLDAIDAPAEIGAHVDLAICRLRDVVQSQNAGRSQ